MERRTSITVKTDPETKKNVKNLFAALGLSVSDAVNLFFNKSITENKLPFKVRKPYFNNLTLDAIKEIEEMEKNPENFRSYDTLEELFHDLKQDDEV